MSKPTPWSRPSAACRIEIRASRVCACALALLGVAGAVSWILSDASPGLVAAGVAVWVAGAARLAWRELRRPTAMLVLGRDGAGELDGRLVDGVGVAWRGPFYTVRWREDGAARRWFAFPDALDPAGRRDLRLWAARRREHAPAAAVAP